MQYLATLTLAATLLVSSAQAMPSTYTFVHEGFSEGARITGSFVGEDLNGDGFIFGDTGNNILVNEVSHFSLSFSGNSLVPAFSIPGPDADFLIVYVPGSGGFANSLIPDGSGAFDGVLAPYFLSNGFQEYSTGLGSTDCSVSPPCGSIAYFRDGGPPTEGYDYSAAVATVSRVPLGPSGIALATVIGLGGLLSWRRTFSA